MSSATPPPSPGWLAADAVVLVASAGGLAALSVVLGALPPDFPAAVLVLQHLARGHISHLAAILARRTPLPVQQATQDQRLCAGRVYIAPPNWHLLVRRNHTLALTQTPPVNYTRPSADPLLASVASCFRQHAIAVILTGTGHDGTAGVSAIKQNGGLVIAQDQATSQFFGMPGAAIASGQVDWVLPLAEIGPRLTALLMIGHKNE
jgi:two-component system chemotaxis response regulator CheB